MFDENPEGRLRSRSSDRRLNVIQLLALSVAIGIAAALLARIAGFGWGKTLAIAWVGSVFGAIVLTAVIAVVDALITRLTRRDSSDDAGGTLDAMIDAWETDLVLDRAGPGAELADSRSGVVVRRRNLIRERNQN